jgi:hypothetical protein
MKAAVAPSIEQMTMERLELRSVFILEDDMGTTGPTFQETDYGLALHYR